MVSPKPLVAEPVGPTSPYAPKPVSIEGALSEAEVAAFVPIDATPADATAVATDLIALRDSLVSAGLMASS
jgi:hypothetical protein